MDAARYRQAEGALWATFGQQPSEHYVTLPTTGTRVRVLEVGHGDPVLLVHGGPNAGSTWAPIIPHLDGFRCLMVDRPGTGLSEPYRVTADNLPAFAAAFVTDVLTELHIDRAHVVASSFGGHIALRSAAASPRRIRRMVQMGCPALAPGETLPLFMRLMTNGFVRKAVSVLPPNPRANASLMRQLGHGASIDAGVLSEAFMDWYLALQRYTDTNLHDGNMIGSVVPARDSVGLDARLLGQVRVPTQFLWGADDTFGDESVARRMVDAMPDARYQMVPQGGHLPWLDDPAGLARATAAFLRSDEDSAALSPVVDSDLA